mmetsp:Transcript_42545/g.70754  ORF Transcript_42545/g.70754 Transcript_42545/m.70754 type:complete len:201 (+) Transcript_42545:248-850(+)
MPDVGTMLYSLSKAFSRLDLPAPLWPITPMTVSLIPLLAISSARPTHCVRPSVLPSSGCALTICRSSLTISVQTAMLLASASSGTAFTQATSSLFKALENVLSSTSCCEDGRLSSSSSSVSSIGSSRGRLAARGLWPSTVSSVSARSCVLCASSKRICAFSSVALSTPAPLADLYSSLAFSTSTSRIDSFSSSALSAASA